jgi:hypothetical protein
MESTNKMREIMKEQTSRRKDQQKGKAVTEHIKNI